MARRFTRGGVPQRQRRSVVWSGQDTVGTLVFGNVNMTAAGVAILPIGLEALEKFTITRAIMDLHIQYRVAAAVGNQAVCYMGVIIVAVEAFVAGAASVPDPRVRQSDDWMYLGMFTLTTAGTSIGQTNEQGSVRRTLDLKGQRKTNPGEVLIGVVALDGLTGASRTISFAAQWRNLLKLT